MIDFITTGIQLTMLFCQGFLAQDFFGSFLEYRLSKSRWNRLLIVLLYGGIVFGLDACLPTEYGVAQILGKKVIVISILCGILYGFYKVDRGRAFFLVVTFLAVTVIELTSFL